MPISITMPRLSDTMEEGTLVKWRVQVGDKVQSGQHLADVETDKATMELQCFDDGTVAKILTAEGQTTAVGKTILILAEQGESIEQAVAAAPGQAEQGEPVGAAVGGASEVREGVAAGKSVAAGPQRVSPVARKLAEESGVDLARVQGTGPDGRVIKRDVLAAAEGKGAAPVAASAAPVTAPIAAQAAGAAAPAGLEAKTIAVSNMRKTIARRLVESKTTVPHFQVSLAVNMDPLLDLRATLNTQLESQGIKLSVNDFITRAVALACVQHPLANSSWSGEAIVQHGTVNVGIAVSLPAERGGGLVVPVIRDAHNKNLRQISSETKALAKKARESGLTIEEMADGTFTISNLGMYAVESFNAIINPPQAAILAVGAAGAKPVVRGGQIVVGHEMTATLSADHRVLDGAAAAEFLMTFKRMLENPAALLV
jgi:pyruvate dehydrogenase E2 component (dihydrolipoamide acetyltransferase)